MIGRNSKQYYVAHRESRNTPITGESIIGGSETVQLSRKMIASNPRFLAAEQEIARELLDVHRENPRMARLMASYKKWLMTHTLFALSKQADPHEVTSGLRPGRLLDVMTAHGAVSRNTASSYLAELVTYKFLEYVDQSADRRIKLLNPTEIANEGMRRWYDGHIACLDTIDGGNRLETSKNNPDLVFLAQPRMIHRILQDEEWNSPPPSMMYFLDSDVCGLLVHYIVTRITDWKAQSGQFWLGPMSTTALAEMFYISTSNIKRIFRKGEADGLFVWEKPRRRGDFWVSETFIRDHIERQAVKFEMVDEAFAWAVENAPSA